MADVKKVSGGDFMLGDVGAVKRPVAKIHNSGELDIDAAERFMDSKKEGEALRAGIDKAASALDALRKTGLTGECLVVLVTEKCGRAANGSRLTAATVQVVLEGLFRLGEYVR